MNFGKSNLFAILSFLFIIHNASGYPPWTVNNIREKYPELSEPRAVVIPTRTINIKDAAGNVKDAIVDKIIHVGKKVKEIVIADVDKLKHIGGKIKTFIIPEKTETIPEPDDVPFLNQDSVSTKLRARFQSDDDMIENAIVFRISLKQIV